MRATRNLYRSERGAIFVQVSLVIFALMVLNVFIVDYGVLWSARSQAQAAADAGALAGATARAYDLPITLNPAVVSNAAQQMADLNQIWGAAGTRNVQLDVCPAGVANCVRVTVARNVGGNPLPTFFGPILGIGSQGITATATAIVGPANTTTCLKPWAIPDEWQQDFRSPSFDFSRYSGFTTLSPADNYSPPNGGTATSRNLSTDYGRMIRFSLTSNLADPIRRGDPVTDGPALTLPLALPGSKTHYDNMTTCNGEPVSIGQRIPIDLAMLGGGGGVTQTAAQANYDSDLTADWAFEAGGYVERSCAPGCAIVSPRLWAVALFDPEDFDRNRERNWPDCGGTPCIRVANIAGFFIDYLTDVSTNNFRHGHLVRYAGLVSVGPPTIIEDGSWLVQPRLIR